MIALHTGIQVRMISSNHSGTADVTGGKLKWKPNVKLPFVKSTAVAMGGKSLGCRGNLGDKVATKHVQHNTATVSF